VAGPSVDTASAAPADAASFRRLRIAVLVWCAFACLAGALPVAARADGVPPPAAKLDRGWEFYPDLGNTGLTLGIPAGSEGWIPVSVPHVFDPRPLDALFGGTVGWYRLQFEAPPVAGYDWMLRFEQIRRVATVWLNGVQLGTHSDPYTPFQLAATTLRDGPNNLLIRVDNRKQKEPREGWWNWGGITRPVYLVPRGAVALDNLGLTSRLHCTGPGKCAGRVFLDGLLINRTKGSLTPQVAVWLRSPSGRVTTQTVNARPLAAGTASRIRFKIGVPKPETWSPKSPALYQALVQVRNDGETTQVERRSIGLRAVTVRNGILYLNGRALQLRGASIQEDVAGHGPALTDADMDRIVSQLKALHANVTRAQYLLNPGLLDRFDRAGILVWSQAPIFHRDRLLETPEQRQVALKTLRSTVIEARSHPSILTHSVANELSVIPDQVGGTRKYLEAAAKLVKDLDPTVPLSVDIYSYPGFPKQQTYRPYQLLGVNNYFGWYHGRPHHSTAKLASLKPYLEKLRAQYPDKALVMTEFGAEATYDGPATVKETYAFQSNYIRKTLRIVKEEPFLSGAIYWTLQEFAVKPEWDGGAKRAGVPRDSIHNKGLLTYDGRPKPAWTTTRQLFAATPLYRTHVPAPVSSARKKTKRAAAKRTKR
jgi:beta-galactosidase